MKKVIIFMMLSLIVFPNLFSQDKLSFSKVIQVDSIQKQYIYNGIKEWIGMNFVSAKNIIEVDDKDAGLIIANALTDYSIGKLQLICYDGYLKYTLKIQIKEGRFKVEITNFVHENKIGNSPSCVIGLITTSDEYPGESGLFMKGYNNKVWKDLKLKADILSNEMFEKLGHLKFSTNKVDSKKDNW